MSQSVQNNGPCNCRDLIVATDVTRELLTEITLVLQDLQKLTLSH